MRDRVLYHAIHRVLYPESDKGFINDSYSCRVGKGTHRGVRRLEEFIRKESKNYIKQVCVLKCDIKKFFDSIDHDILLSFLKEKIHDEGLIRLLEIVIRDFEKTRGKGMPLGNLTSQLFANIYMNEFDWFIKEKLKIKFYIRYCDDFVIVSEDQRKLEEILPTLSNFLSTELELGLHPNKISIRKLNQGIDFLGYVILPNRIVMRTKTKKRFLKKSKKLLKTIKENRISREKAKRTLTSYLGHISHTKSYKLKLALLDVDDAV